MRPRRSCSRSADGKVLLFTEAGEGGGTNYSVYQRKIGETSAVRLGDGMALSVSPDGKWVIASVPSAPAQLLLLPTGPGEAKPLTHDSINHSRAKWLPTAGASFSPARSPVTLRVFTARIRPRESRCPSKALPRAALPVSLPILVCWAKLSELQESSRVRAIALRLRTIIGCAVSSQKSKSNPIKKLLVTSSCPVRGEVPTVRACEYSWCQAKPARLLMNGYQR